MAVAQEDRVTIGRIERPFGVRGEVKVRSLSDVPGRFERLETVSLVEAGGQASPKTVKQVRRAGTQYIVQFAGVTTPEEAGLLRGQLIQIPREADLPRMPDRFYECDLIGLTVQDQSGDEVGIVEATWELPSHHVLVVRRNDREVLIPAVKDFVIAVDMEHRRMVVRVIDGMLEDRDAV